MRNVVFVAPFPLETTLRFLRALGGLQGVRILGVVHTPPDGPDRQLLQDVVHVENPLDVGDLGRAVETLVHRHGPLHRITGILEPIQVQLAQLREHFRVPGPDARTSELFRDKARMKDMLRAHGLPCARHRLLRSWEDAQAFVEEVGFPIVLKPPAGMGCKATWRIQTIDQLREALQSVQPRPEDPTLAEEFLRGREFSFETVTIGGQVRFHSLSHYLPPPLDVMENAWIQWCVLLPRDISGPEYEDAHRLGHAAVRVLGLDTGFTHMEWFRRHDGSLAIGEIAARPPGANIVRLTGLAYDADLYRAWARAVVDDAFDGPWERRYATGCAFLRGPGRGRVVGLDGVKRAHELVGRLVEEVKLPTLGTTKSDSYEGDGYVIVRHEDTEVVRRALKTIIDTIRVHYA